MTLLDKMTVDDLIKVRKMNPDEAERFFKAHNLTPEEIISARKLVTVKDKHHDSRLWLCVGWLLGASFAQLARDKGVTKQSVMVQVDKMLPIEERRRGRISGLALSLEAMSEYKVAFFENIDTLTNYTPKEAALWLLENTSLDATASSTSTPTRVASSAGEPSADEQ